MHRADRTPAVVPVLVVTLPQAKARQARISALLEQAGIPFEFYIGVNGRTDENPIDEIYDRKLRLRRKGSLLSAGQLGCYASHFNIWKQCLETQRPCIVLEDDVTVDAVLFKDFLNNVTEFPPEAGCIRLFESKNKAAKKRVYSRHHNFELLRYIEGPKSTMGYYLTPEAARKFLDCAAPVFLNVDIYMDRYWINDVLCSGIKPGFVFHDSQFDSIIGYEKRTQRRPLMVTVMREFFTLTERVRRYVYNRKFR